MRTPPSLLPLLSTTAHAIGNIGSSSMSSVTKDQAPNSGENANRPSCTCIAPSPQKRPSCGETTPSPAPVSPDELAHGRLPGSAETVSDTKQEDASAAKPASLRETVNINAP